MKQVITRELAKKLIRDYEQSIRECRWMIVFSNGYGAADVMMEYLRNRGMSMGFCGYCYVTYDVLLQEDTVLYNYLQSIERAYLSQTPGYWYHNGKAEPLMITALQIRVDWLQANMGKFPAEKKWWRFWNKK